MTTLIDLPIDILYTIFPYLDANEFLALTSSTKAFETYRQDPTFWRPLTRRTFRIPPQPLLQADGPRWQWLYRRLKTQSRLYTWGSNGCGNLGHGIDHARYTNPDTNNFNIGWPKQVMFDDVEEPIGIIADVQSGGWCTTLLNSIGNLYFCGGIDQASAYMTRRVSMPRGPHRYATLSKVRRLRFPPAYPPTTKDRHEPSTAIASFSTGRSHVLGLADDGKVWQWTNEEARQIRPLHVDVGGKRVTHVVAGWDRASMYVKGTGIVYWPRGMELRTEVPEADAVLIDTAIIPGTGFLVSSNNARDTGPLESRIGQVTNHVALENYIVFTTHLNKVFLYCCDFPLPEIDPPEPIELTAFYPEAPSDQPFEIRDLQGSFRSFAIFLSSGEVLMGSRAMLDAFHSGTYNPNVTEENPTPESHPRIIPDLQYNSIISIAFGDHHFQALRSDGTIYAYGNDPKSCGALGLGFPEGTGPLRGLLTNHFSRDGTPGENIGRQVWFDPTMHAWIGEMKEKAGMEDEAAARGQMILPARGRRQYAPAVKAVGDWFEKEGRRWEDGVVAEEGGMGGYFVLKVAAAGWHSAALVLVDEEIVERARVMHVVAPPEAEAGGKGEVEGEKEGEDDWHGGTWEDIDAPWEQLSKAVVAIGGWMWGLGRRFLGLVERDERDSAEEGEKRAKEEEQKEQKEEVKWTWSEQPFPRLRMADGKVMPGETAVIE